MKFPANQDIRDEIAACLDHLYGNFSGKYSHTVILEWILELRQFQEDLEFMANVLEIDVSNSIIEQSKIDQPIKDLKSLN